MGGLKFLVNNLRQSFFIAITPNMSKSLTLIVLQCFDMTLFIFMSLTSFISSHSKHAYVQVCLKQTFRLIHPESTLRSLQYVCNMTTTFEWCACAKCCHIAAMLGLGYTKSTTLGGTNPQNNSGQRHKGTTHISVWLIMIRYD